MTFLCLTITSARMPCLVIYTHSVEDEAKRMNSGRIFCNFGQKDPQWEDILLSPRHFECVQVVCIHTIFIILHFLEIVWIGRGSSDLWQCDIEWQLCSARLCQAIMTVIQSYQCDELADKTSAHPDNAASYSHLSPSYKHGIMTLTQDGWRSLWRCFLSLGCRISHPDLWVRA